MTKISVIVPAFNSRDTLSACLDSLVGQTMEGLEIVIVDDRSNDDTIKILQTYLAAYHGDKRFTVVQTPEKSGPGSARNAGLACASGEYVAFVDSDDYVEPGFCERLYSAAEGSDADMAYCDIFLEHPGGKVKVRSGKRILSAYICRRNILEENEIRFPDSSAGESRSFLVCCKLCTKARIHVRIPFYHYLIYPYAAGQRRGSSIIKAKGDSFRHLKKFAAEHGRRLSLRYRMEFWRAYL